MWIEQLLDRLEGDEAGARLDRSYSQGPKFIRMRTMNLGMDEDTGDVQLPS